MKKDEVLRVIEEAARNKQVVLYLPDNQLTSLPAEMVELNKLTWFGLSKNQLKALPAEIEKLKNLTMLDLSGNPLESPPIEIAKQGTMAIRSYFESLEAKKRESTLRVQINCS